MNKKVEMINVVNTFKDDITCKVIKKKRVCAYARVSTDEADQLNSYQNQIEEFTRRIKERSDEWEFAGMYSDEGISGTNIKKRTGFNQMIESARNGNIDMILTKSISRFGRNTVDVLSTIHEMRRLNVEIYFEKENLYSSDPKVDFLLTVMSSIAQEESRNISENVKWSVTKRYKEGRLIINTNNFLGYDKDDFGNLIINEEEAKTVKMIYNLFLDGCTISEIARLLTQNAYKTGSGGTVWQPVNVRLILQNEKYSGDAILQKNITIDYLTHKVVKNDNIVPKYKVYDSHEAIIPKETFMLVQKILEERKIAFTENKRTSGKLLNKYPLTGLVFCASCKRPKKRHIWGNNTPYEKVVLDCKHAPSIKIPCDGKAIDNDILESAGYDLIKTLFKRRKDYQELLLKVLNDSLDKENIADKIKAKNERLLILNQEKNAIVESKVKNMKSTDDINLTYINKINEITSLKNDIKQLEDKQLENFQQNEKLKQINNFISSNEDLIPISLFKSVIKMIIGIKNDYVRFIVSPLEIEINELLPKMDELLLLDPVISKTHFDVDLRKNIRYDVVFYEKN